jgi:uncharacterized protein (UPF0335 family)
MNDKRRKELKSIEAAIESFKNQDKYDKEAANEKIEAWIQRIEEVKSEEESSHDNLPDSLKEQKQDGHDEIMGYLDDALTALADADANEMDHDELEGVLEACIVELGNIS